MFIVYILLSLLIIICSIAICYIISFNNLQHYTTKVGQAESIIDETLRDRYDIILQIIAVIDKVLPGKKKLFKDFNKIKDENLTNYDMDRRLTDITILIKQLKADYKDLNDNKDFKKYFGELNAADEKMQAAKSYFNKYTNLVNELIRKFPSNIIAKMHNFEIKLFFDGKDMHDDIIDDFKL